MTGGILRPCRIHLGQERPHRARGDAVVLAHRRTERIDGFCVHEEVQGSSAGTVAHCLLHPLRPQRIGADGPSRDDHGHVPRGVAEHVDQSIDSFSAHTLGIQGQRRQTVDGLQVPDKVANQARSYGSQWRVVVGEDLQADREQRRGVLERNGGDGSAPRGVGLVLAQLKAYRVFRAVCEVGGMVGQDRHLVEMVMSGREWSAAELAGQPSRADSADVPEGVLGVGDGEDRSVGEWVAAEVHDGPIPPGGDAGGSANRLIAGPGRMVVRSSPASG